MSLKVIGGTQGPLIHCLRQIIIGQKRGNSRWFSLAPLENKKYKINMKLLITGGAGFIGSNFVHYWMKNHPDDQVIVLDKLTYAGHKSSLKDLEENPNFKFTQGDICDSEIVKTVMQGVDIVVHFAAESHVDRSIIDPLIFVKTNVLGTSVLLEAAVDGKVKRFHHISTDEVFGELGFNDAPFNEGKKVPLMGEGENIRSWIYVEDHNRGVETVLEKGEVGETYLIGGEEKTNKEVTLKILKLLGLGEDMIERVEHRLGHDLRYAIDDSKLRALGWEPKNNFEEGLKKTVDWFKENEWWWKPLKKDRPNVDREAQKSYE